MSGDLFVDTPRGPAFTALMGLTVPVSEILLEQGMCATRAGFVASRCVEAVLQGLDGNVPLADFLNWGREDWSPAGK